MSSVDDPQQATPKRRIVSLPLVGLLCILGIGGYFAGPWLMTQYFYLTSDKAPDGYQGQLPPRSQADTASPGGGMSMGNPDVATPEYSESDAYSDEGGEE